LIPAVTCRQPEERHCRACERHSSRPGRRRSLGPGIATPLTTRRPTDRAASGGEVASTGCRQPAKSGSRRSRLQGAVASVTGRSWPVGAPTQTPADRVLLGLGGGRVAGPRARSGWRCELLASLAKTFAPVVLDRAPTMNSRVPISGSTARAAVRPRGEYPRGRRASAAHGTEAVASRNAGMPPPAAA
jgi:hypothetical protein